MYFDKLGRDSQRSRRLGLIRSHPKNRIPTETLSEEALSSREPLEALLPRGGTFSGKPSFQDAYPVWGIFLSLPRSKARGMATHFCTCGPSDHKPSFGWCKQIQSHPVSQSQGVAFVLCCDGTEAKDERSHRKQQDGSGALKMQCGRSFPVMLSAEKCGSSDAIGDLIILGALLYL